MRQSLAATRLIQMRQSLVLIMLFSLLVVYVIWTSNDGLAADASDSPQAQPSEPLEAPRSMCSESWADRRPWLPSATVDAMPPTTETPTTTAANATSTASPTTAPTPPTRRPTARPPAPGTATNSTNSTPTTIYFVTPTHPRREQIAELTRLGQTLMHVPHLHWIVADDTAACSAPVAALLQRLGMPYTHIASPMHASYRQQMPVPRGVANRRAAIAWLLAKGRRPGVMYFGDDDNTFDLRLFDELRRTRKVSMFPVGLIGLYALSAPVVREGKVIGFFDSWPSERQWPVDMAGFAVSLDYLLQHPKATMPYDPGYEEEGFLKSIALRMEDIEPLASNCTEVLVWHTQTKKEKAAKLKVTEQGRRAAESTNLARLLNDMHVMGVSQVWADGGEMARETRGGKTRTLGDW